MARGDLTLRGLLPVGMAKPQHPYKPAHHRGWVDALLERSDRTVRRVALRQAILYARDRRASQWRIKPLPQIFDVLPDGTVREVAEPSSEVLREVKTGLAIGALAALPWVVPWVLRSLGTQSKGQRRRRR